MDDFKLGKKYLYVGKYEESLEHLSLSLKSKKFEDRSSAYFLASMDYLHLDKIYKAQECCHNALAIDLDNPLYRCFLGILEAQTLTPVFPLRSLRAAINIEPDNEFYISVIRKLRDMDEYIQEKTKELKQMFFDNYDKITHKKELFDDVCLVCRKETTDRQALTECSECHTVFHAICLAEKLKDNPICPNCSRPYDL